MKGPSKSYFMYATCPTSVSWRTTRDTLCDCESGVARIRGRMRTSCFIFWLKSRDNTLTLIKSWTSCLRLLNLSLTCSSPLVLSVSRVIETPFNPSHRVRELSNVLSDYFAEPDKSKKVKCNSNEKLLSFCLSFTPWEKGKTLTFQRISSSSLQRRTITIYDEGKKFNYDKTLLFLLYINISYSSNQLNFFLFADTNLLYTYACW